MTNLATAQDHQVVDIDVALARECHNLLDAILLGDDIDHIALHIGVVAVWNDRATIARDSNGSIAQRLLLLGEREQGVTHQIRRGVEAEHYEREFSVREIDILGCCGVT